MSDKLVHSFLLTTILLLVGQQVHGYGKGSITIENNGYRGILIAIHEDVTENWSLVERIKEVFTSASAFLYSATRYI